MSICYRSIIISCYRNNMSAPQTVQFVKTAMGAESPCKSTIFDWYKKFKSGRKSLLDKKRPGRPADISIDRKIRSSLRRNKFSSARSISKSIKLSHQTVLKKLKKHGFRRRKIKCFTYRTSNVNRGQQKNISLQLLNQLTLLSPNDVITSDESWFFLDYNYDWMWVRDEKDIVQVDQRLPHTRKYMVCIFWNFGNLFYISVLDKEEKYNSELVVSRLFPELEEVAKSKRPRNGLKSFSLHWDNGKPHQSILTRTDVERRFKQLLVHPPYCPHLAPSDFFLFGYLKDQLRGKQIEDKQGLKTEIEMAFKTIKKETKVKVFEEWKKRLGEEE